MGIRLHRAETTMRPVFVNVLEARPMPNTTSRSGRDQVRVMLERFTGQADPSVPPSLVEATQGFLTAMEYQDVTLMRSHLETAMAAFQKSIDQAVQNRLGSTGRAKEICDKVMEDITNQPCENWDEIGRELESYLSGQIKHLVDLRDGAVKLLQDRNYEILSAPQLERDIRKLQALKNETLGNWPWSSQQLPPVDRRMVAESRAAIQAGEIEQKEQLIRRLQGRAATES
jgi:hypothetical protein